MEKLDIIIRTATAAYSDLLIPEKIILGVCMVVVGAVIALAWDAITSDDTRGY